jgi:hypothetical protein
LTLFTFANEVTTQCSSEFLKAIVLGYGYTVKKEELHLGTIRLTAEKVARG